MKNLSKLFGSNLKKIRKSIGISQRNFSEMTDMSESTIISMEHGQVAIHFSTLEKLAKALDVPPYVFFIDESADEQDIINGKIQHAIKDLPPEKLELIYNLIKDLKKI